MEYFKTPPKKDRKKFCGSNVWLW